MKYAANEPLQLIEGVGDLAQAEVDLRSDACVPPPGPIHLKHAAAVSLQPKVVDHAGKGPGHVSHKLHTCRRDRDQSDGDRRH